MTLPGSSSGTPPPFPPPPPFLFSGQEQALYNALFKRDERLAIIYKSAVMLLRSSPPIPDRLSMAAHNLREMMEKIPYYLLLPVPKDQDKLGNQVNALVIEWEEMKAKRRTEGAWEGAIDSPLKKWLLKFDEFVLWKKNNRPAREARTAAIIREIDVAGGALPKNIEILRVKEWDNCRDFFVNVCHHKIKPPESEFFSYLSNMERFLLDRLYPRTFTDHKNLDDIIREGDEDAQA